MEIVLDKAKNDAIKRIYALEANGEKYLVWCADEGCWEVTLEPSARRFRCKRDGVDVYVYPAPSPESIIVYDNGIDQREFIFADGMLIPHIEAE